MGRFSFAFNQFGERMQARIGRARTVVYEWNERFVNHGRIDIPYSWTAAFFQGTAILGCTVLWLFGAPSGVSVACLATAAVVMAFRINAKDFRRAEQIVWIVLSAAFLYIEISSITRDRAETVANDLRNRSEERAKFEAVIEQGRVINEKQKEESKEQQQKFTALLSQGGRSIKDLEKVASKVSEGTSFASGGETYPTIFPYQLTTEDGRQRIGFSLSKQGKYPLFDLRLNVGRPYSVLKENNQEEISGVSCKFPEINGNWNFPLLAASMDGESSAYFTASMYARNGTWEEVFDVRRVDGKFVSRWVIFQTTEFSGPLSKILLDLADQNFPPEHRHDALQPFPNGSLPLPDVSQQQKAIPDLVLSKRQCTGFW
jgi:hypothetical protein